MSEPPKMKIVHLLSGGLDSVTMLYDLKRQGYEIHCLLFDYKQRHVQELVWAKHHARLCGVPFTMIELPQLGGLTEQSWIVPNRNAVFLSVAVNVACQMGFDAVTIGCNEDDADAFPDCRAEFIDAMNAAAKVSGYNVNIRTPYIHRSKKWINRRAKQLGVNLREIWTCYRGGEKPCGECPACKKLEEAKCGQ